MNVELIWLTGRLSPDFKTIADFRKDNGAAIRSVCREFVVLCRQLNLFTRTIVAIDGSKFKAVNNRDKNFTVAKVAKRIEQVEASIARYLAALDRADREDGNMAEAKTIRLKEKIEGLRRQMQSLREIGQQVEAAPDKQVSLIDPDARSMATSGKGTGIVGYNVQIAVDAEHHLIVAHDVTNVGSDRAQLTAMSRKVDRRGDRRRVGESADLSSHHVRDRTHGADPVSRVEPPRFARGLRGDRQAYHALKSLATHKTDRNDARGLAHLARSGFFKPVHVKSLQAHALRSLIIARKKLVGQRVTLENQIRGLAVAFGIRLPARSPSPSSITPLKQARGSLASPPPCGV